MYALTLFFIICQTTLLVAQLGLNRSTGAQNTAMGDATVALMNPHAVFHNSAGLVSVTKPAFIINYDNRFSIKELKAVVLAAVLPTTTGVFGAVVQHFGSETYREQSINLAFGKKFTNRLNGGVRLAYNWLRVEGYEPRGFLNFDIGLNTLITNNLNIGFLIQNPHVNAENAAASTPSVMRLGVSYFVNKTITLAIETEKNILKPPSLKCGLLYQPSDKITLRTGFATQPIKLSVGIGYALTPDWVLDCAFTSHAVLGLSPSISFMYCKKSK